MQIDRPLYRHLAFALAGAAGMAAAYLVAAGRQMDAAILAGLVLVTVGLAAARDRVPSLFTLFLGVAVTFDAIGYVFDLWTRPVWFDEAMHVITPFAFVGAIAWVLIQRNLAEPRRNGATYFAKVLFLGLLIGLAWEGFEYVAGIIGSRMDSLTDLAADLLGSLFAALFCLWTARRTDG